MNERALENWLDSATERTFQTPFAHSLAADGYAVVHVSRHCAMEMGKDILAVAPDGTPCAFQLKNADGKQLTLSKWRDDLERQLVALVHNKIVHPSITSNRRHRSFIVINGELSEEVANSIDQFNRALPKGIPKLKTIVRGELLDRFKRLGSEFWPADISFEFKSLLEILLTPGTAPLPKVKLASLLESALQLEERPKKTPSPKFSGKLNGIAILCSYAIAPFQKCDNHAAEFEAWTMLFGYILGFSERNSVPESSWVPVANLIQTSMLNALGRLCDELRSDSRLTEGDSLIDRRSRCVRATYLIALMSLLGLWRRATKTRDNLEDECIENFLSEHAKKLWLWGEGAAPQFLVYYLHTCVSHATLESERILMSLISGVSTMNHPRHEKGLASPYYDVEQVLADSLGSEDDKIKEKFAGTSYTAESFLHLLVNNNFKQAVRQLWPPLSRIAFSTFTPESPWRFYQWRAKKGLTAQRQMRPTQDWSELRAQAAECKGKTLPRLLRRFPLGYLAFVLVYPHRLTADGTRWVTNMITN